MMHQWGCLLLLCLFCKKEKTVIDAIHIMFTFMSSGRIRKKNKCLLSRAMFQQSARQGRKKLHFHVGNVRTVDLILFPALPKKSSNYLPLLK